MKNLEAKKMAARKRLPMQHASDTLTAAMDANADAGDPLAEYRQPLPPVADVYHYSRWAGPLLAWLSVCALGICAIALFAPVLGWWAAHSMDVPDWVLPAGELAILCAGSVVALALICKRK